MTLQTRLDEIRSRIAEAAIVSGRAPDAITLVAVSKRQPLSLVQEACALGLRIFGENYAQELRDKAAAVTDVQWHFIGRFQKNKINMLKTTVACWQTLASVDDAQALAARLEQPTPAMLQVNIGNEPQKGGIAPDAVLAALTGLGALPHLQLVGLMCIPPAGLAAQSFAAMRDLALRAEDTLGRKLALSMGMSDDYEEAIRQGATHVRIGSRLFGPRN